MPWLAGLAEARGGTRFARAQHCSAERHKKRGVDSAARARLSAGEKTRSRAARGRAAPRASRNSGPSHSLQQVVTPTSQMVCILIQVILLCQPWLAGAIASPLECAQLALIAMRQLLHARGPSDKSHPLAVAG